MNCPNCQQLIEDADIVKEAGRINGRKTSKRKAKACASNGRKGGRPAKIKYSDHGLPVVSEIPIPPPCKPPKETR